MESNYNNSERNYEKTSCKRCCGGIKLNPRRFCVQRLRTNFMNIVRVLRRWKNYYKNGVRKLITRNLRTRKKETRIDDVEFVYYNYYYSSNNDNNNKRRVPIMEHSNSFSSEAIADCLEFIKRNSVSVDDDTNPMLIQHN